MSVRASGVFSGRDNPVMRKLYSVFYDNSLWVLQFLGSGRCGIRCDEAALSAEVHLASSALRSSSSMRHMPWTNASRSRAPVCRGSHSFQMSLSFRRSRREVFHMYLTICPLSLSSARTCSSSPSLSPSGLRLFFSDNAE